MATEQFARPDLKLAPETGEVLFDVQDLEVYFPIQQGFFKGMVSSEKKFVKAVDHITFQVKKGEILALVGESGCGKTTTGRTLLRLEDATGGDVLYKAKPVNKFSSKELRDYRKKAQIIFQDPYNSINPKQTIFDIVAEPLEVNNICSSEREKEETVCDPYNEAALYLQAMADSKGFEGMKSPTEKLTGRESVTELLNIAIGAEKNSVLYYVGLKDMVPAEAGRDKVEAIIREEVRHIADLRRRLAALKS